MRIKPIEKPKAIFLKLVYWITKKQYGKVISPIKTIYSRSRPLLFFGKKIIDTEKKVKNHAQRTWLWDNPWKGMKIPLPSEKVKACY
ncbi:hypothetical protein SAMN05444280_103199, partial [Tangfeifania diversioriginum]